MPLQLVKPQNLMLNLCVAWGILWSELYVQAMTSSSEMPTLVSFEWMLCSTHSQPSWSPGVSMILTGLFLSLFLSLILLSFWLVCHFICCSQFHGTISLLRVAQHQDLYCFWQCLQEWVPLCSVPNKVSSLIKDAELPILPSCLNS